MTEVEVNPNRLMHLLSLYGMRKDELLERLNRKRKIQISDVEVFGDSVKASYLRKIDEIFKKGIAYYVDPKDLLTTAGESIFFRKHHFNADLNFGAKRIISQFENEKLELSALAKLSDMRFPRLLPTFDISIDPESAANKAREIIQPVSAANNRDFLKASIDRFAELNILVFEFVEAHNLIEKANIDGCFVKPDMIILKRNQRALKREIFTLYHELGHFFLDEEEIDDIGRDRINTGTLGSVEKWCSSFAFFFLLGNRRNEYISIPRPHSENGFSKTEVERLASNTFLSSLAIYTRLKIEQRISPTDYDVVSRNIIRSIEEYQQEEKRKNKLERELALAQGRKIIPTNPKPIVSPLYLSTLKNALLEGQINEVRFCKKLRIKPEKLEDYFR